MTKFKSLASSIVVSSLFVVHLINTAQSCVAGAATTVISPLAKM